MKTIEIKNRFTEEVIYTFISENATLRDALIDAVKNRANLSRADLFGADLQPFCKWNISIIDENIKIGCKIKSINDWDVFFNSTKEYETKRGTEEFKKIQAVFECYKTYINFLR